METLEFNKNDKDKLPVNEIKNDFKEFKKKCMIMKGMKIRV